MLGAIAFHSLGWTNTCAVALSFIFTVISFLFTLPRSYRLFSAFAVISFSSIFIVAIIAIRLERLRLHLHLQILMITKSEIQNSAPMHDERELAEPVVHVAPAEVRDEQVEQDECARGVRVEAVFAVEVAVAVKVFCGVLRCGGVGVGSSAGVRAGSSVSRG